MSHRPAVRGPFTIDSPQGYPTASPGLSERSETKPWEPTPARTRDPNGAAHPA